MQRGLLANADDGVATQALEENFRAKVTYFPRHHPTMRVHQLGDVTCVDSSTACDMFNCVMGGSFTRSDSLVIAQTVYSYYARRHLPVAWWVGPSSHVAARRDILSRAGFSQTESETAMVASLQDLAHPPTSNDVHIVRVESTAQVADFGGVIASLFPKERADMEHYFASLASTMIQAGDVARYFVGYVDGKAVATASLFVDDSVVGLYDVATRPTHRNRGLGAAITSAALRDGESTGLRVAGLSASKAGRTLYARMGFRPVGVFDVYGRQRRPVSGGVSRAKK